MPKLKTNSSAKKRLKITKSGKVKFKQTGKRHNLSKKSQTRIRNLRKGAIASEADTPKILRHLLPNGN